MNFYQQIIASLIGTFVGFVFSIVLFYLTEKWKSAHTNKNLSSNIQRELQYNVDFLNGYKDEFEKMLRQVTANTKPVYLIFKHSKLQRLFILEAFQKGLLYKYLTVDEINNMDVMINYFLPYRDQALNQILSSYNSGQNTAQSALATLEWDRDQIDLYIKILKNLKTKLKELK